MLTGMIVAILTTRMLSVAAAEEPWVIVRAGETHVTIVHADKAPSKILKAAARLQSFLLKITGVKVPIHSWSASEPDASRILIGPQAASTVGVEIQQEYPGRERVLVQRINRDLVLAGNDAGAFQGTRHAVDRLLLEFGCECFGPNPRWHVVPQHDEAVVTEIAIDTSPEFGFRSAFFFQDPHIGGHPDFDLPSWGMDGIKAHMPHNYYKIVPYALYEEHPEYFALVDGQRTARGAQICFTNRDVIERTVKAARGHFDNDPTHIMFSLSANDCAGFCECNNCRQLGENAAGQSLAFANTIVRELRTTHPDKGVAFIAYLATEEAPKRVQADPGVQVWMINSTCRVHAAEDTACPTKQAWIENLNAWLDTGVDVSGIYEYYIPGLGGWKHVPLVLGESALEDLRYYRSRGIRYMYYESFAEFAIEDCPIRWPLHYLIAKGTWDLQLSATDILKPACHRLFGAAANPMFDFYMEIARACESSPLHGAMWVMPKIRSVYTPDVRAYLRGTLDEATRLASTESAEVNARIEDVIECWRRTKGLLTAPEPKPKYPRHIEQTINGVAGVHVPPRASWQVPVWPGSKIPTGDSPFTLFFVGRVTRNSGQFQLVRWGNLYHSGHGSAIELEGESVHWATGWGDDAITPAGSFSQCFDKPALICISKSPGPINTTTSIWINGIKQPLLDSSSTKIPKFNAIPLRIGGPDFTGEATVGDVILFDRVLPTDQLTGIGAWLNRKYRLATPWNAEELIKAPADVAGLCAWLRPSGRRRPVEQSVIHKDDFESYPAGTELRGAISERSWRPARFSGVDQHLKVTDGIVERNGPGPWSQVALLTNPLQQDETYARIQADIRFSESKNAHYGGVFLNATHWESGEIGNYAQQNLYKLSIASEGFFSLNGHNDNTGQEFVSGRLFPYSPLQVHTWYTVILEAHYGTGRVMLEVTIQRREDGAIVGRYHYVDTEVLLKRGAAGLHIQDTAGVKFQIDNCELQLVD